MKAEKPLAPLFRLFKPVMLIAGAIYLVLFTVAALAVIDAGSMVWREDTLLHAEVLFWPVIAAEMVLIAYREIKKL